MCSISQSNTCDTGLAWTATFIFSQSLRPLLFTTRGGCDDNAGSKRRFADCLFSTMHFFISRWWPTDLRLSVTLHRNTWQLLSNDRLLPVVAQRRSYSWFEHYSAGYTIFSSCAPNIAQAPADTTSHNRLYSNRRCPLDETETTSYKEDTMMYEDAFEIRLEQATTSVVLVVVSL